MLLVVLTGCASVEGIDDVETADASVEDAGTDAGLSEDGGDSGVPDDEGPPEEEPRDGGWIEEEEPDAGEPEPPTDGGLPPPRFWWDTEVNAPADVPHAIWGDGHVHSNFSGDGNHPALDMMNRAKQLGADFVWITDHARTPIHNGGISEAEFDICSANGNQASDADQFAGCGIEYRLGYTRENGTKVYEAWHQIVHGMEENHFGEVMNERGYTSWTAYQKDLASLNAVYAVLTHPSGPTAWYNDDDGAYRDTNPANHPDIELIELNGGDDNSANGNNRVDGINTYLRFLNDGWQVSPIWDSDMHHFYNGEEKAKGYGAWIDKVDWKPGSYRLTLRRAVRKHNTFANHPGNQKNYIRMISLSSAGGAPEAMMGSTLPKRDRLHLSIRTNITSGNKRWHFKLFTNLNRKFPSPHRTVGPAGTQAVSGGTEQEWTLGLDTTGIKWVVAYASPETGAPGGATQYVVSAPIWINNR